MLYWNGRQERCSDVTHLCCRGYNIYHRYSRDVLIPYSHVTMGTRNSRKDFTSTVTMVVRYSLQLDARTLPLWQGTYMFRVGMFTTCSSCYSYSLMFYIQFVIRPIYELMARVKKNTSCARDKYRLVLHRYYNGRVVGDHTSVIFM